MTTLDVIYFFISMTIDFRKFAVRIFRVHIFIVFERAYLVFICLSSLPAIDSFVSYIEIYRWYQCIPVRYTDAGMLMKSYDWMLSCRQKKPNTLDTVRLWNWHAECRTAREAAHWKMNVRNTSELDNEKSWNSHSQDILAWRLYENL